MHFRIFILEVELNMIRAKRCNKVLEEKIINGVPILEFPSLSQFDFIRHAFSTRLGGVSKGEWSSMNFSFSRGDDPEAVLKNYEIMSTVLACDVKDMVASKQTHTTNIRRVSSVDKGKGIVVEADYDNVDGFITNEPDIVLSTFYADCVPLYFVDPVHKAIGLAHSGWRGTAMQMGKCMVEAMQENFESKPEELVVAIGPSICQDCYEVDSTVANVFVDLFKDSDEVLKLIEDKFDYFPDGKMHRPVIKGKQEGKYQLDLWLSNLIILLNAGVNINNISVTDLCTCHNPDYLFSHRASKGKRGNLGAFLKLEVI